MNPFVVLWNRWLPFCPCICCLIGLYYQTKKKELKMCASRVDRPKPVRCWPERWETKGPWASFMVYSVEMIVHLHGMRASGSKEQKRSLLWLINCTDTPVHLMHNKWFVRFTNKKKEMCSFSSRFEPISALSSFSMGSLGSSTALTRTGRIPLRARHPWPFHGQHDKRFLYQFISFRFRARCSGIQQWRWLVRPIFIIVHTCFMFYRNLTGGAIGVCFVFRVCLRCRAAFVPAANAVYALRPMHCGRAGSLSFSSRPFCRWECVHVWANDCTVFRFRDIAIINYIVCTKTKRMRSASATRSLHENKWHSFKRKKQHIFSSAFLPERTVCMSTSGKCNKWMILTMLPFRNHSVSWQKYFSVWVFHGAWTVTWTNE